MSGSIHKRLFVGLSVAILVTGLLAAALVFSLAFEDANELQDAQLLQISKVLSHAPLSGEPIPFTPVTHEDFETHLVIKLLGSGSTAGADPAVDVALPESLATGLQTIEQSGYRWRVVVAETLAGQRFGVAQRMTIRDEVARDTALLTLAPQLLLIPVLLLIVAAVLRRAFEPMVRLSATVDQLDENQPLQLDESRVPREALPLLQAVNRLIRRLGLALEQQRRLVADAAHELRTPVATLTVQANNVLHVDLPKEARERMHSLQQGLTRMSSLIEQLLDFARVQGAARGGAQRIDLDALVRSAVQESLPAAHAKRVDLGCVTMDSASVQGDRLQAYALVRNAVDNAVRYTPEGGSVDVSVTLQDDVARFTVEDTGPGIAPEFIERVFEPFVRIPGTRQTGSGLGLAIARTAADALGGRIELGPRADGRPGLRFAYFQPLS